MQNKPKEHVLLSQKYMLTPSQTIKHDVPEEIKIKIETEFEIEVVEHK